MDNLIERIMDYDRYILDYSHVNREKKTITLFLKPNKRFTPICCHCHNPIKIKQNEQRQLRELPILDYSVYLEVKYRKGYCPKCGKIVVEHIDFTEPYMRETKKFSNYVYSICLRMSISEAARVLELTRRVTDRIFKNKLEEELVEVNYDNLRIISVDEIAIRKGHTYATVIINVDNGTVLSMEEGRKMESLAFFYSKLNETQKNNIEAVVMDCWPAYIKSTQENLPNARIITDYFHMIKRYNKEVLDKVRIDAYKAIEKDDVKKKQ